MRQKSTTKSLEKLHESIINYDFNSAEMWAKRAIEEKVDPLVAADSVTMAIRQVGNLFGQGDIFLPELVASAKSATTAMSVINEELKKKKIRRENVATLVIGTVKGDIHDIGKNIVSTMFLASGFEVIDLGVDVSGEKFLEAIKVHNPDIVGMSALLTTTAPEQKAAIELLKKAGVRDTFKLVVGGAAITQSYANQIGADGFGATAPEGVQIAKKLLNIKQER